MKHVCPNACAAAMEEKDALIKEVEHIKSIYELSANDIDGMAVEFNQFEGSVLIFVNIAMHDGLMTEEHFKGMLELHERVKHKDVEFLLFPCDQFSTDEPTDAAEIKEFFTEEGFLDTDMKFTLMEPIAVNGPEAHIVYKFAKYDAHPPVPGVHGNFDPYFLVHPNGDVESRPHVDPRTMFEFVMEHFASAEL
jgi:glutathione peroxidase-family protein